ncbi:UNVERIFIED_CONTAM: hypothetical protein GTU68_003753 [Idotea baltica]|nr:hypothetical protein [Idotea baltica]
MRDDEADAVIALWTACDLTRPWNPPEADIALARGNPNADVLVAEEGGALVSAVMVGHDGHRAWVYYLAVSPDLQRGGWGRKAMVAAEEWARERGLPKIHLMVRHTNAGVVAFYQRLGYADAETLVLERWLTKSAVRSRPPRRRAMN